MNWVALTLITNLGYFGLGHGKYSRKDAWCHERVETLKSRGTEGDHAQMGDGEKEKWLVVEEINGRKGNRSEVKSRKIENTGRRRALTEALARSVDLR